MKTIRLKITKGSLPTSPVKFNKSIDLPVGGENWEWLYEINERILWIRIVYKIELSCKDKE